MKNPTAAFCIGSGGILAIALAMLLLGSACASLPVVNGPTTQAINDASAVTGAVASTVAAVAPPPWGAIAAGILGAVSVIAGIVAHSSVSKTNAQQVVSAVNTGLQAAAQSLNASVPAAVAAPAAK
jgi:hypothetical protein